MVTLCFRRQIVSVAHYFVVMRWYARPENNAHLLRVTPRLASWNKADHRDQVRLREYLDDTEALLADSKVDAGPWALRLDVGLPANRDLLNMADLDNYALPLAYRLKDQNLVSVWCTKRHNKHSFVRIEPAQERPLPSTDVVIAHATSATGYKEKIHAAVAGAAQLPPGPVTLELSFVVGPGRNWLNLWKETIDALDPLLGRAYPNRPWNPLDGRITELGMHVTVEPSAGYEIEVGIAATQAAEEKQSRADGPLNMNDLPAMNELMAMDERKIVYRSYGICISKWELPDGTPLCWGVIFPHWRETMLISTDQAETLRDALNFVLAEGRIGRPNGTPSEIP